MKQTLSNQQLAILGLAVRGFTDKQIAKALKVENCTLRAQWSRIFDKTGAVSRINAYFLWLKARPRLPRKRRFRR